MEFRANFAGKLLQNFGWVTFYVLIIQIIYANVPSIAGWDKSAGLILGGTVFIVASLNGMLFISLLDVPDQVRKGTLDFVLTRPVDTQFSVSLRKFEFGKIGSLISGFVMLGYGIPHLSRAVAPWDLTAYIALTLAASAVYYAITFVLATVSIYFVRTDNIWVIGEIMTESARYPVDVFPKLAQKFAFYVIPVAIISTVPARALKDGVSLGDLVYGFAWVLVAVVLSRWFWLRSLRAYSSASS